MSGCASPIPEEALVSYLAGDAGAEAEAAVEEHLLDCATCAATAARLATVTEAMRRFILPVVTATEIDRLTAAGRRVVYNRVAPGERKEVVFGPEMDLLIHQLDGLDLEGATQVSFELREESTGDLIARQDPAPFEPEAGAVFLACQRHYAALPHDTVAEIRVQRPGQPDAVSRFTIIHHFMTA